MNRLAFGDFHAKHFGPEQKAYWQNMLQQQQQQQQQQQYYSENAYNDYQYEADEPQQQDQSEDEEYYPEEDEEEPQLSKEAIEIFEFSEAFRKEKELEQISREKDDKEGMQDWQYDESTVLCSGGMEAPTTSLVLTQPRSTNEKNKIHEELLNSAYLNTCRSHDGQEAVVLWPVLPFRF